MEYLRNINYINNILNKLPLSEEEYEAVKKGCDILLNMIKKYIDNLSTPNIYKKALIDRYLSSKKKTWTFISSYNGIGNEYQARKAIKRLLDGKWD